MTDKKIALSGRKDVQSFLDRLAKMPQVTPTASAGRLIFALDATASREPAWARAQKIQQEMFTVAAVLGGLEVQLCYYRGLSEFHTSAWTIDAQTLRRIMSSVTCMGGYTQIAQVLEHAQRESRRQKINALVFIGDCMEENVDLLCQRAGELGLMGVRSFIFQEGHDPTAELTFRQIATLTRGAYCRFDGRSVEQLRELLGAVAAYAAGGLSALEDYGRERKGAVLQITHQIKRP
jgi:hypothetical protein